jgi:hypothetical protein
MLKDDAKNKPSLQPDSFLASMIREECKDLLFNEAAS